MLLIYTVVRYDSSLNDIATEQYIINFTYT